MIQLNKYMVRRNVRGTISIYTAMSLFLIIAMFCVLLESARTRAVKAYVQYAMASASDTMLGAYCRELQEEYGLLMFDGSYNTEGLQIMEMEYEWQNYFNDFYIRAENSGVDLLHFQQEEMVITEVRTAIDAQGEYFVDSVYEYMKYQNIGEMLSQWNNVLSLLVDAVSEKNDVVEAYQEIREESQDSEQDSVKKAAAMEDEWMLIDRFDIQEECQKGDWKNIVAVLIYPALWEFSFQDFTAQNLPSVFCCTDKESSLIQILEESDAVSAATEAGVKHLTLVQYDFEMFSSYISDESEETPEELDYELEYILIGNQNEYDNFVEVVNLMLFMRTVCNCVHILGDEEKMNSLENASKVIFSFTLNEAIMEAGKYVLLYLWAYAEGIVDVRALLDGEEFGLIKAKDEWVTDLEGITESFLEDGLTGMASELLKQWLEDDNEHSKPIIDNAELAPEDTPDADILKLGYDDYLFLLFILQNTELLAYRTMDVIQIRMQEEHENFLMQNMIYGFVIEVDIECHGIFYRNKDEKQGLGVFLGLYPEVTLRDYFCY